MKIIIHKCNHLRLLVEAGVLVLQPAARQTGSAADACLWSSMLQSQHAAPSAGQQAVERPRI